MTYHKIQSLFKRDPETKNKTFLVGEYSIPEFEYLKDNIWQYTEKIDGTNIRICLKDRELSFKGRSDNAQLPANLVNYMRDNILVEKLSEIFPDGDDIVLYGEGCGAKIQKGGGNYYSDQRLVLFDIRIDNWWLKRSSVEDIAKKLDLPFAPIIGEGTLDDMVHIVRTGIMSRWGGFSSRGHCS